MTRRSVRFAPRIDGDSALEPRAMLDAAPIDIAIDTYVIIAESTPPVTPPDPAPSLVVPTDPLYPPMDPGDPQYVPLPPVPVGPAGPA